VEGDAADLARAVAGDLGGRVTAHHRFGTAKWVRGGVTIDIASARREYYRAPTALPSVVRGSLRSDLRRRDFTVNALALDLNEERFGDVVDPFGGWRDLAARQIRVLHSLSFVEDPTRILRAVRFQARLGFELERRTAELIPDALDLLPRVSGARLRNELRLLFAEPDPARGLARLEKLGVLGAIQAGLRSGTRTSALLDALPAAWSYWERLGSPEGLDPHPTPDLRMVLWLAEQGDVGVAAARRLCLRRRDADLVQMVADLVRERGILQQRDVPLSSLFRHGRSLPAPAVVLTWLCAVDPVRRENLRRLQAARARARTLLTGRDLGAMGVAPGPTYRRVLGAILDARLDGTVATRAEEEDLARRLLAAGAAEECSEANR
jgi:tRNA nucleotidyltransferase (CCA-adding enzyme)